MKRKFTMCVAALLSLSLLMPIGTQVYASMPKSTEIGQESPDLPSDSDLAFEEELPAQLGGSLASLAAEKLTASNLPASMVLDEVKAQGYVSRVKMAESDLQSLVLAKEDGSMTLFYYNEPVKFVDNLGFVWDKSLNIVPSEAGFATEQNDVVARFGQTLSDGISLAYEDSRVVLTPALDREIGGVLSSDGKKVSYAADDRTNYVYSLTYSGFKEEIVVSEYTGQTEYTFDLDTAGLYLTRELDSYLLVNDGGEVCGSLSDVVIFTADERNNTFGELRVETVEAGQSYRLTVEVDGDWLADPRTAYPITIDPSVTYNTTGNIEDVSVISTKTHSGTSGSIFVGRGGSGAIIRTLMRFPKLNVSGWNISAASVSIRDLMCEDSPVVIECREYTGNSWSESTTTTWASVGSNTVGGQLSSLTVRYGKGNSGTDKQRYVFDITSLARKWADGSASPSKGVLFKAEDAYEQNGEKHDRTFASINRGSNPPILTVEYTPTITLSQTSADLYVDGSLTLSATVTPYAEVAWSSSNPAVAEVSSSGKVTGKGTGTARITATAGSSSAACTVTVTKPDLVILSESSSSDGVLVNSTVQMYARLGRAGVTPNSWSSSDPSVATVSSSGLVTAKSAGVTEITATYGSYTAKYTLYGILSDGLFKLQNHGSYLYATMEGNAVVHTSSVLEIEEKTDSRNQMWHFQYAGEGKYLIRSRTNPTLAMAATPGNTGTVSTVRIGDSIPSSASSAFWTITGTNGSYIIKNRATGKVMSSLTGSYSDYYRSQLILEDYISPTTSKQTWIRSKVSNDVSGIQLYKGDYPGDEEKGNPITKTLEVGKTLSYIPVYYSPEDFSQDFTWSSSDTSVATVTKDGVITAVGTGTATVTVRHNSSAATREITVTVESNDPFHYSNIQYMRYVRITGTNWWGLGSDTDHTVNVVKSTLCSDDYCIIHDNINQGYYRVLYINNDLKSTLNNLEAGYQEHYNVLPILDTTTTQESAAHSSKEETDQLVKKGYFSKNSSEYYGVWAYNYVSSLNLVDYWRGVINTATAAFGVYLTVTSFYHSYLITTNTTSMQVTSSQYNSTASIIDDIDDIFSNLNLSNKTITSAEARNGALNLEKPPYKPGTPVVGCKTTKTTQFVRVYSKGVTSPQGKWIMRYSDIQGLSPAQIKDKFALPKMPTHYCYVNVPAGVQIYIGVTNQVPGWGDGNALQFELGELIPADSYYNEFFIE